MRNTFGLLVSAVLLAGLFSSCAEDVIATTDAGEQLAIDLDIIDNYISEKGYSSVDTTSLNVHYAILSPGSGAPIELNDIVSYHLTASLTDDVVWFTTLDSVAINNDIYSGVVDSLGLYIPEVVTYTPDGWNVGELISGQAARESGYRNGVGAVLGKMNIGGHARFLIPSLYAFAGTPPFGFGIPANAVLIYDIYPVYKR